MNYQNFRNGLSAFFLFHWMISALWWCFQSLISSESRWKTTENGDKHYLPEVRHRGRKWALRGDVSRVAGVMVHLGEGERTEWVGVFRWRMGGREEKHSALINTSIKASIRMQLNSVLFSLSSLHISSVLQKNTHNGEKSTHSSRELWIHVRRSWSITVHTHLFCEFNFPHLLLY